MMKNSPMDEKPFLIFQILSGHYYISATREWGIKIFQNITGLFDFHLFYALAINRNTR